MTQEVTRKLMRCSMGLGYFLTLFLFVPLSSPAAILCLCRFWILVLHGMLRMKWPAMWLRGGTVLRR